MSSRKACWGRRLCGDGQRSRAGFESSARMREAMCGLGAFVWRRKARRRWVHGRSSTWVKLGFVLLEITVCSKSECRWWPAEILCTTQESIFSIVLLGVLICTEQEGRGFDQSSLSTGGPTCVVQELPGTPAGAPYGLGREQGTREGLLQQVADSPEGPQALRPAVVGWTEQLAASHSLRPLACFLF